MHYVTFVGRSVTRALRPQRLSIRDFDVDNASQDVREPSAPEGGPSPKDQSLNLLVVWHD